MARILAIDYGLKRTGIAVSDPLQLIATGLDTIDTPDLLSFLKQYISEEEVEAIVIGMPLHLDGTPTALFEKIEAFILKIKELFPSMKVDLQDERFTSLDAKRIIVQSGIKKKKRRDKKLVDKVSAILILQEYMGHR